MKQVLPRLLRPVAPHTTLVLPGGEEQGGGTKREVT